MLVAALFYRQTIWRNRGVLMILKQRKLYILFLFFAPRIILLMMSLDHCVCSCWQRWAQEGLNSR